MGGGQTPQRAAQAEAAGAVLIRRNTRLKCLAIFMNNPLKMKKFYDTILTKLL